MRSKMILWFINAALVGFIFSFNALYIVYATLFLFIGIHAIGQSTIIWVFFLELFSNHIRFYGQAFGTFVHWVGTRHNIHDIIFDESRGTGASSCIRYFCRVHGLSVSICDFLYARNERSFFRRTTKK